MGTVTGLTAARMLAIEAASVVSGAISGDNLILTKHDGSTINAGNVRGIPGEARATNRLINGGFSVNQREISATPTTGISYYSGYVFDRWRFVFVSSSTSIASCSMQTPDTELFPEGPKNYMRISIPNIQTQTSHFTYFQQIIESVRTLSGKTATLSFWARAATGTPYVAMNIIQSFGTGGTPSSDVQLYLGKIPISTSWTRYSITFTVPSIAGKVLGTDDNDGIRLRFYVSAGSEYWTESSNIGWQAANTYDFWGFQLEEGQNVSSFELKTFDKELRDCQRYFQRLEIYQAGYSASASVARFGLPFVVPLRIAPSAFVLNTAGVISQAAGNVVPSSLSWIGSSKTHAYFGLNASGLTTGQGVIASGQVIDFSAEY